MRRRKSRDANTYSKDTPRLDRRVGFLESLDIRWQRCGDILRTVAAKPLTELLLLLLGVWREPKLIDYVRRAWTQDIKSHNLPLDRDWFTLEPIWHKNLVLLVLVARRKDVSALERLFEEPKDVEYGDDALRRVV